MAVLLEAMGDRQDQLPLIQHALMRMWSEAEGPKQRRPAHITLDVMRRCGIQDSGSVAGALDQHADEIYGADQAPPSPRQELIRRMFCALCRPGGDGRQVRRIQKVREIAALVSGDDTADGHVTEVITVVSEFARLGCNFLVTTPPGEVTAESDVDISHESLIRNWQRLGHWLEAEDESATRYRRLAESAQLHAEEKEGLLTGRSLEVAAEWWFDGQRPTPAWRERYASSAFEQVESFLLLSQQREQEGQAAAEQAELDKAEAKERELQLANRLAAVMGKKATIFRRLLIVAGLATAIAVILAVIAFNASRESRSQAAKAQREKEKVDVALENLEVESTKSKAAALMAGLGGVGLYPAPNEYEFLKLLAGRNKTTQLAFMDQLLTSANKANRLRPRYPYLLHAVVGLDVPARDRIKLLLFKYGENPSRQRKAINVAVAELGMLLAVDDADFDKMVAKNLVAAMEKTTDYRALSSLGSALGSLGEKIPGEQALAGALQIVAAMEKTTDSRTVSELRGTLGELVVRLPSKDMSQVLKSIVCVGETRKSVLAGLQKRRSDEKVDGNLWKALIWLEEQGQGRKTQNAAAKADDRPNDSPRS